MKKLFKKLLKYAGILTVVLFLLSSNTLPYILESARLSRLAEALKIRQAEAANANGMVVYGSTTATSPKYRTWNGSNFSAQGDGAVTAATVQYVVVKEGTTRDEKIMGTMASTGAIHFQVWNGSTWNSVINPGAVGTTNDAMRGFDIAYEQISGRALVVYEKDTTADAAVYYQTWNGSAWSGEQTLTYSSGTSVPVQWVKLEAKPRSNEIMLVTQNDTADNTPEIRGIVWNGSSWINEQLLTDASSIEASDPFDAAYEDSSGEAMVGYGTSTATDYWTYINGTWIDTTGAGATCTETGTAAACVTPGAQVYQLKLTPGRNNNYLSVVIVDAGADLTAQMWDGSAWVGLPAAQATWDEAQIEWVTVSRLVSANSAFETTGNRFMFAFGDNGLLLADYFWYDLDTGLWYDGDGTTQITDIDSVVDATPATSDDVEVIHLDANPDDNSQIMITVVDLLNSVRNFLWNGSSWTTPTQSTQGTTGVDYMDGAYFTWDRTVSGHTIGTSGTQTSPIIFPAGNTHTGGAFTAVLNTGAAQNITSITITESGTVNANTNLSDVVLFYKQEAVCSSSIPVDATQWNTTGATFNVSEKAAVTGDAAMSVGTSQVCIYVRLDVGSGVTDGQTMEIEISNPSTEVASATNAVAPSTSVAISGTTTLDAETVTVSSSGTQTSPLIIPSGDNHTGGAFTFVRNTGSANVTSITITDNGTVNANTNLSDVILFYKQEGTCSSTIPGDATQFNSTPGTFNASEKSTVTGTISVGTSQICLYVRLDVGSGVTDEQTMEIRIANPSTEITVSAGLVKPATAVDISGTTELEVPKIVVATEGTQASTMAIGVGDVNVGGAFSFTRNTASANVTSIVITDTGTVNANANISDVRVYYKQEGTCSSTIPVDATLFNSSAGTFNGSEKSTVTGTISVGTSKICVYVRVDVGDNASDAQTLEIEISNPSTEVTVSAGSSYPASAIAISGTTTLNLPSYTSYGIPFLYTANNWGTGGVGVTFYLETYMKQTTGTAYARLYNETDSLAVSGSTIYTTSGTYARVRSAGLPLTDGKTYRVQIGKIGSDAGKAMGAKLVVNQNAVGGGGGGGGGGADLAEFYASSDSLDLAEVVAIDPQNPTGVKRSTNAYQKDILGVVATQPGIILGQNVGQSYPIALVGRVPVKVSLENGLIKSGDRLTSSSIPGFAMKATKAGRVIGEALEDIDPENLYDCNGTGMLCGNLMVFVNLVDYSGAPIEAYMAEKGFGASELADGLNTSEDISIQYGETKDGVRIQTGAISGKQGQILEFLKLLKEEQSRPSSEIFTDRLSAVFEIVAPTVITDTLYAKKIKADSIEGLDLLVSSLKFKEESETASRGAVLAESVSFEDKIANKLLSFAEGITVGSVFESLDQAIFRGFVDFIGQVIFRNDVEFEREVVFNKDSGGFAQIKKGQKFVDVVFEKEYKNQPIINVSPTIFKLTDETFRQKIEEGFCSELEGIPLCQDKIADSLFGEDIEFAIQNQTTKGFLIVLNQEAPIDVNFSWQALVVKEVKTSRSEGPAGLVKPFEGDYKLSNKFGEHSDIAVIKEKDIKNGLKGHDGTDIGLPFGTPVLAADEGVVESENSDYGKTLVIKHKWGKTVYGHLSETLVKVGDSPGKGQKIALSGDSGLTTGPHLHFGIKLNRSRVDNGYNGFENPNKFLSFREVEPADAAPSFAKATDGKKATEGQVAGASISPIPSPSIVPEPTNKPSNEVNLQGLEGMTLN